MLFFKNKAYQDNEVVKHNYEDLLINMQLVNDASAKLMEEET